MTRHSFIDFHRGYTIQIVSCDNNFQLEISTLQHRGRECQQLPPVIYTCCKFKLLQFCLAFISPYFSQVRTDQQLEVSEASGVVFGGSGCFFCGVLWNRICIEFNGLPKLSGYLEVICSPLDSSNINSNYTHAHTYKNIHHSNLKIKPHCFILSWKCIPFPLRKIHFKPLWKDCHFIL